jgi:hypothetical protein
MKIQTLIDKISEQDIGLWDMPGFSVIIRDTNGKTLNVDDIKVDADKKTVRIRVK